MLDLDHLKKFNDSHGHKSGDMILESIAKLIKAFVRESDFLARYGGEEFVVVLPETGLEKALELAERLRRQIVEYTIRVKDDIEVNITASIGIATFPEHAESYETLLDEADKALYIAKNSGRNRCEVASNKEAEKVSK